MRSSVIEPFQKVGSVKKAPGSSSDRPAEGTRTPTIRDIAREAGVSVGTVSHYLNATAKVASPKAEAVQEAMRRLDYTPNANARSLRTQVTRTIGLIVPNLSNPFYAELASNVGSRAFDAGYELLLGSSFDDEACETLHLTALRERRIDGALVVATGRSSLHHEARPLSFPCVFIDREVAAGLSVTTDNRLGGKLALEHLLSLGHRRVGLLLGDVHVPNIQERLAGAREALGRYGVTVAEEHVITGPQSIDTGRKARRWWDLDEPPTGIFATNDVIALGVWQSCLEAGVRLPDDVSLVGFDDIQWASLTVPALTTVRQDLPAMAARGFARLIGAMSGEPLPVATEHIAPKLVIRESTRATETSDDASPAGNRGRGRPGRLRND